MGYKSHIINIVKLFSVDLNEIVDNIQLEDMKFNSIEWIKPDTLILHRFKGDLDFEFDFDEFDSDVQREIYLYLLKKYF